MGHLAQLTTAKKTSLNFRSLIMSFESIIDITEEVLCLLSFIAFIVFNNLFGMQNYIFWGMLVQYEKWGEQ